MIFYSNLIGCEFVKTTQHDPDADGRGKSECCSLEGYEEKKD